MEYADLYNYCPRCKADLKTQTKWLIECTNCDFYLYINPAPCNAIILENNRDEILLVRRKFDPKKGYWDLPGGFVNINENFEESIKREIQEELGVEINNFKYLSSFSDRYVYRIINYYTLGVVFTGKINTINLKPQDDVSEIRFFKKSEIPIEDIAFPSLKKAIKLYLE